MNKDEEKYGQKKVWNEKYENVKNTVKLKTATAKEYYLNIDKRQEAKLKNDSPLFFQFGCKQPVCNQIKPFHSRTICCGCQLVFYRLMRPPVATTKLQVIENNNQQKSN